MRQIKVVVVAGCFDLQAHGPMYDLILIDDLETGWGFGDMGCGNGDGYAEKEILKFDPHGRL